MPTPQPRPSRPAPPAARRPAPRRRITAATAALLAALALTSLTSCASDAPTETPSGIPFNLFTHCGITELTFDGSRYARVGGTLGDGFGNPPAGWGNPSQDGWLLLGEDSVTFQDAEGHTEVFTLRLTTDPDTPACS
ncbi:hypothetical protein SAMN05216410_1053 [Sanguibacter gelidistatuariae]|uniref:Secreted protein n=1 Tax=Sanguibacter gelidistatuariae TaxID=1814289 RepID=A0A1G6HHP5_9MICO|nr:hypothetical protein [Sanguibacter gelidistatuariae]SDB93769.1 hypothetical protein SAMN05216410_1053 [Sanguibacter gelidistatuariae]